MPITTSIKKYYARWTMIVIAACLIIGLWGVYDYVVKLPRQQRRFERFVEVQQRMAELQEDRSRGVPPTDDRILEFRGLEEEMAELAPGGENPVPPSKFDWVFQWACILCVPFVPYMYWQMQRLKRRQFRLDEDGTLHVPAPAASWKADDIAAIDMKKWMSRSIAFVFHRDGTRVKLDDYTYQDMHRIVGAIAHRLHPDQWDVDARPVEKEIVEAESAPGETDGGTGEGDAKGAAGESTLRAPDGNDG